MTEGSDLLRRAADPASWRHNLEWLKLQESSSLCVVVDSYTYWGAIFDWDQRHVGFDDSTDRRLHAGQVLVRLGCCRFRDDRVDTVVILTPSGTIGWLTNDEVEDM